MKHSTCLFPPRVKIAYKQYLELWNRYRGMPTHGQKAALTRRWNFFVSKCKENKIDPKPFKNPSTVTIE